MRGIGVGMALFAMFSAGCEGLADIPNDRVICCQNGDEIYMSVRINCVFDRAGRVVAYALCDTDGGEADAAIDVDAGTGETAPEGD